MSIEQKLRRIKRSTRIGTFTFITGAVLLAVILAVNLLVGALPNKITKLEIAKDSTTRINQTTKEFVKGIKDDVTIYWLCENGEEDGQLSVFLSRYTDLNDHIRVQVIDTLKEPTFAERYTQEKLPEYSFIIVSDKRSEVVNANEMTEYELDVWSELNGKRTLLSYSELENIYRQYGQYLTDATAYAYFRGESALNTALDYVTVDSIPHAYLLTGHGDTALPGTLSAMLKAYGMEPESVNLQTAGSVPADASCVILFAPSTDISQAEAAALETYFAEGGSVLLVTDPQIIAKCPRVAALGESFGLTAQEGMVADSLAANTAGNSAYDLVPNPSKNQYVSYLLSGYNYTARMPYAHAIGVSAVPPAGTTPVPMLSTSSAARRMSLSGGTPLCESTTLHVAAASDRLVTRADGSTKAGHMIWFGSTEAFSDTALEQTSMGNGFYFLFSVMYMSESFRSVHTVDSVDMNGYVMSGLTTLSTFVWIAVLVVIIPLALLVTGIVIWVRRRRR